MASLDTFTFQNVFLNIQFGFSLGWDCTDRVNLSLEGEFSQVTTAIILGLLADFCAFDHDVLLAFPLPIPYICSGTWGGIFMESALLFLFPLIENRENIENMAVLVWLEKGQAVQMLSRIFRKLVGLNSERLEQSSFEQRSQMHPWYDSSGFESCAVLQFGP